MKKCTRCHLERENYLFQPPVSICLPCYWMIPENRQLTEEQLREKAIRSRFAARGSQTNLRERLVRTILPRKFQVSKVAGKVSVSVPTKKQELEGTCERCNKEIYESTNVVTWKFNDHDEDEEAKIWCITCSILHSSEMNKKASN